MAETGTGTLAAARLPEGEMVRVFLDGRDFSSTMVFHSPHAGHFPSHFGDSAPQLLQNHTDFTPFICL